MLLRIYLSKRFKNRNSNCVHRMFTSSSLRIQKSGGGKLKKLKSSRTERHMSIYGSQTVEPQQSSSVTIDGYRLVHDVMMIRWWFVRSYYGNIVPEIDINVANEITGRNSSNSIELPKSWRVNSTCILLASASSIHSVCCTLALN